MGFLLVMKAELVRGLIIMRRYWFRTITGMVIGYAMLAGLIYAVMNAGQSDAPTGIAEKMSNPEGAITWALGFIIGMFAFGIIGMFTMGLQQMAQNGQLEQLCTSPHGLVTNFMARATVGSFSSILTSSFMVWLLAKTFGSTLHFDPLPTVLLLGLTFANLLGFGFMVGGLVLVFKQTGQVAVIIRLGLFALAVAATDKIAEWPPFARWFAHALPVTDAAICLKYVLIQGQHMPVLDAQGAAVLGAAGEPLTRFVSVFVHPSLSFYFLVANCVVWTMLGITCFRVMETWSRSKGTLGAY